jgi:1,4-dihydroxy-2-naphthoate octaprenyltransferase
MFSLSSLLHLRIPFSYFLLPIFLFSLALSPNVTGDALLWTFVIVHFFLYPASNAYNSYFDKDEKSIGILKNPPPVKRGLYYLALLFDLIALGLALWKINVVFALMLLIYGLVSKAYSHPSTRLKKYAIGSWVITGLFQGLFTFVMCYVGINKFEIAQTLKPEVIYGGILTSIMLWANYPLTQVYQHEEDTRRGDHTFSIMLGIRGTFYFVGLTFGIAAAGFVSYFLTYANPSFAWKFLLSLMPVITFFMLWMVRVMRDESRADYKNTMWLNFISATCLNVFFVHFFLERSHILDAF